jgi:transposase
MAGGRMETERMALSQRERDRLRVLQEVKQGHLTQREAARRIDLCDRQVRRLLLRLQEQGDRAVIHGLRGRPSNRRFVVSFEQKVLARIGQRYADFGPTLAAEHLAKEGLEVSRETVRKWMTQAAFWCPRSQRVKKIHVWRERRGSFGELVMQDSSPFRWLEERGPGCQLIALIDDATSRIWARFTEHDTTEENLRTLEGWLRRYGRPLAHYTDKNSIFRGVGPATLPEQLRGERARSQFGRALKELGIEWIAAQSPQAKGRIERLFETLQDRLVKEMRLAGIDTLEAANHFLETRFLPEWEQRFTVTPRNPRNAHRRLGREHRLEEVLSVRVARKVTDDHTVSWDGNRWGVPREEVCAGLRGAQVEIERRLDGTHWLRFRGRYLPLHPCPNAPRSASPSGLRPPGLADQKPKPPGRIKPKYHVPAGHPWRKPWRRTFLSGTNPDISTLR